MNQDLINKLANLLTDMGVKMSGVEITEVEMEKFKKVNNVVISQILDILRSNTFDRLVKMMNSRLISNLIGLKRK